MDKDQDKPTSTEPTQSGDGGDDRDVLKNGRQGFKNMQRGAIYIPPEDLLSMYRTITPAPMMDLSEFKTKPGKRRRNRKQSDSSMSSGDDDSDNGIKKKVRRQTSAGLKIRDSGSSEDSESDQDRLDYESIVDFFVQTDRIKTVEKGRVNTLLELCGGLICKNENIAAILKGIPAHVMEQVGILSKLKPKELHSVDKILRKRERLSVTDKFWQQFCEQHFNYGTSDKPSKPYKHIYAKICGFFRNEARKVDRGIKRRDEKLRKQVEVKIPPVWKRPIDEECVSNDDYDKDGEEIDYPENSHDIF